MRAEIFTLLLVTWPRLHALFVAESEQDSYDGELHDKIALGCRFSRIPSVSRVSVIWRRISPPPTLEVYHLEMGQEKANFTNLHFRSRVRLLKEELRNFRAVIELSQLRLNDSGTYRCIVIQDEADYKQTKLTVRAPYKAIEKSVRRRSETEVELSCESQGFPLARVTWSGGRFMESRLTNRSLNSHALNDDGTIVVTSRVSITDAAGNYTCTYASDDGKPARTATFLIPDDICETNKWTKGYAAVAVIVLLCAGLVFTLMILRRTKKARTRLDAPSAALESSGPELTVTSSDHLIPYSDSRLDTFTFTSDFSNGKTEKQPTQSSPLSHTPLSGETQNPR